LAGNKSGAEYRKLCAQGKGGGFAALVALNLLKSRISLVARVRLR
jgi:hypothetical protein